jgi:hypothetical protein
MDQDILSKLTNYSGSVGIVNRILSQIKFRNMLELKHIKQWQTNTCL